MQKSLCRQEKIAVLPAFMKRFMNSSDGRLVRASLPLELVDSVLIPRRVKPITLKLVCPAVWHPMAGVALQLLVMEDVLSSDPTRGSCFDFPFSRPGRTTFVLLL